jgi:DNA mismatch repair protein MSH3
MYVKFSLQVLNLEGNYIQLILTVTEDESPEILTFLYEVTIGSAGRSYGLNVARLANLPPHILQLASGKAQMLESWANSKW